MTSAFPLTRQSAVFGAHSDDPAVRERAWATLASAYWRPAYAYVRIKWKATPDDARDALQGFFEQAVAKGFFEGFEPRRARFRTFFKLCLDRYLSNQRKAAAREKRGGPAAALAFDEAEADLERAGAAAWESPEACFEREWRRQLFAAALQQLERRATEEGKGPAWTAFARYDLVEPPRPRYEDLARELGVPVTTVTNWLSWARGQLRALVRQELAALTATEAELESEAQDVGVG